MPEEEATPLVRASPYYPLAVVEAKQKQDVEKSLSEVVENVPWWAGPAFPVGHIYENDWFKEFSQIDILSPINKTPFGVAVFSFLGGLSSPSDEKEEVKKIIDDLKKTYFEETKLKAPKKEGRKEIPLEKLALIAEKTYYAPKEIKESVVKELEGVPVEGFKYLPADVLLEATWETLQKENETIEQIENLKEKLKQCKDEKEMIKEVIEKYGKLSYPPSYQMFLTSGYTDKTEEIEKLHSLIGKNKEAVIKYNLMRVEEILEHTVETLYKVAEASHILAKLHEKIFYGDEKKWE